MKKKLLLSLMVLCSVNAAATVDHYAGEGVDYTAVVIKFSEKGIKSLNLQEGLPASNKSIALANSYGMPLSMKKLFNDVSRSSPLGMNGDKNGLNRYYEIKLPQNQMRNITYINDIINAIDKEHDVEAVYPDSKPIPLDSHTAETGERARSSSRAPDAIAPSFVDLQYYMKSPDDKKDGYVSGGINAFAAHEKYPGIKGQGVTILSTEIGHYDYDHLDLPTPVFTVTSRPDNMSAHDTMSVGTMAGKDNDFGVTGIANQASIAWNDSALVDFVESIKRLKPGDVVQLGIMTGGNPIAGCTSDCGLPMEYGRGWFDAIKTATDSGIHVIAAAGNSGIDLGHPDFEGWFDRKVRDSGSILAGALDPETGKANGFSNHGTPVGSATWGVNVVTTYSGKGEDTDLWDAPNAQYTATFSGTSSANPIIAGAVAGLSGLAKQNDITLSPAEMRKLIMETGSPIDNSAKHVGTQPDMVKAAEKMLGEEGTPAEDLVVSDLQAGTISGESATVSFKVKASGKLALEAEVVDLQGVRKGSASKALNDNSMMVSVALSAVIAGDYFLRYSATNEQGTLIKQESLKFTLSGELAAPAWDPAKTYDKACTAVTHDGKVWMNGWWIKGTIPGSDGEWGVWRLKGASNMHSGC